MLQNFGHDKYCAKIFPLPVLPYAPVTFFSAGVCSLKSLKHSFWENKTKNGANKDRMVSVYPSLAPKLGTNVNASLCSMFVAKLGAIGRIQPMLAQSFSTRPLHPMLVLHFGAISAVAQLVAKILIPELFVTKNDSFHYATETDHHFANVDIFRMPEA